MSEINSSSDWANPVIAPAMIDEVIKLGNSVGYSAEEASNALTAFFASVPDEFFMLWDMLADANEQPNTDIY